jgi:hypothetical protein
MAGLVQRAGSVSEPFGTDVSAVARSPKAGRTIRTIQPPEGVERLKASSIS